MKDFLFRGSIAELDFELSELLEIEAERQYRKLILIPSESTAPLAVREALRCAFQNIYAEGYPDEETRRFSQDEILDYDERLTHFRRFSDPRYYKGVEYADILEALARRRCAELFAVNEYRADDIYVNIQPLSGAPANNAVYHALINPGDTILGMNLLHGGHLSHGSSVNRSGKYYNAVHYGIDPETERIDYDKVAELAIQHKPKIIVAGYSSYPWIADWKKFREIADSVGAYLLTDIAHIAGLVAGGVYPSPVGHAHVITFTTHKSLCGPRGACILTCDPVIARKIDRAVFPGEQGGPHVNTFAAMALTFKLARTEQFRKLQAQIVENCIAFTDQFTKLGFKIPFGGTNTHLMNLDVSAIKSESGATLSGDQAARILDIAGIVVNRNTIPGDASAADPSGIRMGTPWVTQRGLKEQDMRKLAEIIADLLRSTKPFLIEGQKGTLRKANVGFDELEKAKIEVRDLAISAGIDFKATHHNYPHFYYLDDAPIDKDGWSAYDISGEHARPFLNYALSCDLDVLKESESAPTNINIFKTTVEGFITFQSSETYQLSVPSAQANMVASWLRDLSDGFIRFDDNKDISICRLPGPVVIKPSKVEPVRDSGNVTTELAYHRGDFKPYFIGMQQNSGSAYPEFTWNEQPNGLKQTPLYAIHKGLGAKMISFAGWEMPVWYRSVFEEHTATRRAAGLFDVTHMGVYQAEGPEAATFLDGVCANDIGILKVGESCYTHFLTPNADVIDDAMVYRWDLQKYLIVVNASNDDKDWAWLNAVKEGAVLIDRRRPWAKAFGKNVVLRNLRDEKEGNAMRVDIAIQGPKSRDILLKFINDKEACTKILSLERTQVCRINLSKYDLIVARTGYTGEKIGFECFIHPDKASAFFADLLDVGEAFGIKPVGLGGRDSLRTEAGLPLYGYEMGIGSGKMGNEDLTVSEAGFSHYVKCQKPWFIGRGAFLSRLTNKKGTVVRFSFNEKGVRMAHQGDPVVDKHGQVLGWVTSCAIDSEDSLTGQAYIALKNAQEGTKIFIYQGAPEATIKQPVKLSLEERVILPSEATIKRRFL